MLEVFGLSGAWLSGVAAIGVICCLVGAVAR